MIHKVCEIAAEVIQQTGRDKSADAALREVLKQIKDLASFDATEIAKTVFIHYRWQVWLRDERGFDRFCVQVALKQTRSKVGRWVQLSCVWVLSSAFLLPAINGLVRFCGGESTKS